MDNLPGPHDHQELSRWLDERESPEMALATVYSAILDMEVTETQVKTLLGVQSAPEIRIQRERLLDRCDARAIIKLMGHALDVDHEIMERLHPIED